MANGNEFPQGGLPRRSLLTSCGVDRGRGYSDARLATECICERPYHIVLCCNCGFNCRGRVAVPCKIHPNVFYLTDVKQCPKCKAHEHMLSELRIADSESGNPGARVASATSVRTLKDALTTLSVVGYKPGPRGRQ